MPLAGICAGGGPQGPSLPRMCVTLPELRAGGQTGQNRGKTGASGVLTRTRPGRRAGPRSSDGTVPEYSAGTAEGTGVRPRGETKVPRRYRVLMHNDDYTTMEFVVEVLQSVFRMRHTDAMRIMLRIQKGGVGIC